MDTSRISTCTYPMREREIDYALRVCAEAGFKKADVWGRAPHFSEDQSQCDWPALKQTAAELGIAVANLGTYPPSRGPRISGPAPSASHPDTEKTRP